MFYLFFSIALDPLEQSLQGLLLSYLHFFDFSLHGYLQFVLGHFCFEHFLMPYHVSHSFSSVIVLNSKVYFLLLSHSYELFASSLFCNKVSCNLVFFSCPFLLLLCLELLNQFKRSDFIITHISIPCHRELLELSLLSFFDID
jgi:hypothetical protein